MFSRKGNQCVFVFLFFFQAEDGIRDLVRSRGLGDVYKRQELQQGACCFVANPTARTGNDYGLAGQGIRFEAESVSYTHLTLPTIYSV